jgi:23S rRNA (uracil1939-C5)-methyltransferase
MIPSPIGFNYRNRIQLHSKKNQLGYYQKNTHTFLPIDYCAIADEKINKLLPDLSTGYKRLEIAVTQSDEVITRNPQKNNNHNLFSQVNTKVNNLLIEHVSNLARNDNYSHIYDAYCGQGNFSFPLHKIFPSLPLTGVEFSQSNVKAAQAIHSKINFVESSVESYFRKHPAIHNSLVILDPPRAGCHKSIFNNIAKAKKIIYISCDLSTFERDAKILIQEGYEIKSLDGFDMFPQTSHIEVCASFNRSK